MWWLFMTESFKVCEKTKERAIKYFENKKREKTVDKFRKKYLNYKKKK